MRVTAKKSKGVVFAVYVYRCNEVTETVTAITNVRRPAALAGFVGALVYLAIMALARTNLGVLMLPEIMQTPLLLLIPGEVFSTLIDTFATAARPMLFVSIVIGIVFAGGFLGTLFARLRGATIREGSVAGGLIPGLVIGFGAYLFLGLIFYPILGAGFFALEIGADAGDAILGQLLPCLGYGVVMGAVAPWLYRISQRSRPSESDEAHRRQRRRLLQFGMVATVLVAAGGAGLLFARNAASSAVNMTREGFARLSAAITPVGTFYNVSKNFFDPVVKQTEWSLTIGGLVDEPYELTLEEIRAMPATIDINALQCISNEVGGSLIGNGEWKGVFLKDLLERAGVQPGAVDLKFTCADDYTESITIEKALSSDVRLVYEMNGAPLTDKHGFPARLLVPGIYGMKNVKWVEKMEVVGEDYRGFWQQQGWDDAAPVKLMSRIDLPESRETVGPGVVSVGGVAFSGDLGISKVEVSFDEGESWNEAELLTEAVSPQSWYRWVYEWEPEGAGPRTIRVRAHDGSEAVQTSDVASPFSTGATGYHTIRVTVIV